MLDYLDAYNEGLPEEEQIVATDLAGTISDMTGGIMDGITIVSVSYTHLDVYKRQRLGRPVA